MLILYDINHNKIAGLKNYKEYKIEREINKLDILSFLYPVNDRNHDSIKEECYIRTKENEYVVKEINYSDENYNQYICKVNIESIQGTPVSHFETVEQTCTNAVNLAIAGTGWTIGNCNVTKKRTTRKNNCSAYDVLVEIQTAYKCEMTFDAINKKVYIYQSQGSDKGVYFSDQLNLKKVDTQSDSYDYITRLIAIGKDGLDITSVNSGKNYVENYQYSNKIITAYWEDNRYTVVQNLKDDAVERLDYLSKPLRAYSADIIDLANANDKYKDILDYSLGDTITLLSKERKVKEKQRIVKLIEYPDEPERNTVEIANKIASLDDLNVRFENTSDTVDSVTTSAGGLDGSKVDSIDAVTQIRNLDSEVARITNLTVINANIDNLFADKANINELNAVTARIGTLEATSAKITDLDAINADIVNLHADKADITDLTATNAKITTLEATAASIQTQLSNTIATVNLNAENITAANADIEDLKAGKADIADLTAAVGRISSLESDKANITDLTATNANITNLTSNVATIQTLVNGNITSANMATGAIQAGDAVIANGAISNAMIGSVSIGKLLAGNISTNKFTVQSDSGNLKIQGNTLKAWDTNGKERISLGLNGSDYNLLVRGADGTTVLFGTDGVTNAGITEGAVDDSKVAESANINAGKIEKESLVVRINGATTLLKGSKIKLDTENQTLDLAFTSLKTVATNTANTVSSQGTAISVIQGQISSKIWQTDITTAIDDVNDDITTISENYSELTQTVNGITSTVTSLNSVMDTTTGNVTSTTNRVSIVEQTLEGLASTVSSIQTDYLKNSDASTMYATATNVSSLSQTVDGLTSSISSIQTNYLTKSDASTTYSTSTRVSTVEQTVDGLTSNISSIQSDYLKKTDASTTYSTKSVVSTLSQTVDGLTSSVSVIDSTVSNQGETINSHSSSISALQDGIVLKLASSTFNAYKDSNDGAIDTINSTLSTQSSNITLLQESISLKVEQSSIDSSIDKVRIGGENLLQNSGKFSTLVNWFSDDMTNMDIAIDFPYLNITKISGTNLTIYNDSLGKITWDTTSDYMITMVIKSTGSVDFKFSIASKDGSKVVKPPIDNVNVNNQEIIVSYKFKPAIVNNNDMNLFLYLANMSNGTIFSIKTIMLEKGNKASDWSPSGLELRTGIENNSDEVRYVNTRVAAAEIKLTDDSIVSTVTNSSTYVANQESIDNKITSLTSTVNENRSYIIQLSDAITFKVSYESFESYQTTTNGYISNLTDTMYTKASNDDLATTNGYITAITTRVASAESSISTLADSITLKVSKTDFESYQTTTNGYISDLTNNKANDSDLETTNGYVAALTTRVSTAESSITSLADSITLKVNTMDYESYQTTTNGYITSLTTRMETAESSITAMNDSITLKVSKTDFESYQTTTNGFLTSLTNGKANSTDLESTNNNLGNLTSRVSTAESSITALSSSIVLKVSNTDFETYKTTTNGYITNLTNAMYNKASYDDLDTTNGYIEALTTRVETAESSITAMNNNINLKVSTSTFESYQTFNNGNVSSLTTRVESAESSIDILSDSITSKVDVNGVKSIIEQGASQIQTAFDGLTGNFVIKNGHLVLKNSSDTNVMWVDSPTGRLTCNSLDVYGEGSNTIYFHGNGSKRVQIQSDNGGTCLLAFRSNNYGLASQADILSYTDAQPLGNLFFQPRDYLVIRSSGSTPEVNKPVHLSMWGDIELNGGTYLNDDGHVGSSWNGTTTNGNITIGGTLNVAGAKHKIVKTSSGAVYAMNAVESPDCLFIVRGRGKLLKGECRIEFEEKWLQVVNTELGYDIVPIPYGDGNVYADLDTMTKTGFTMKGDNDINFGFIVFAKQIGCEDVYMEKIMVSDEFYRNMK